jgi:MFS family permease
VAKLGGILPPRHLAKGMSFFGLAGPGGVAVGPLVGLWLMPRLGFAWMLMLLASVFAVLHVLISTLPGDAPLEAPAVDGAAPGLASLGIGIPILLLFLLGVGFGPMPPYSAQEAKALHMGWPSAFLTCFALGMMGMRALIGLVDAERRPGDLLSAMLLLAASGVVILTFLPGGTGRHVAAGLLYGAGYSMVHTLLFTHLLNTTPAARRGAAVGALFFAFDIGTALGSLGLGYVMEHAGFRWGWSATLLLLLISLPLSRRLLRLRAEGLGQGEAAALEP